MKMGNQQAETTRITVRVKEIRDDSIVCNHVSSGYRVKAFINKDTKLVVGQVVLLEYKRGAAGSGYVVVDELMEEVEADVLEAQHIINNGMMYTSLILENPITHRRMHSLVPSNNQLFCSTNVVIAGDHVKLKMNNGNIFSIEIIG